MATIYLQSYLQIITLTLSGWINELLRQHRCPQTVIIITVPELVPSEPKHWECLFYWRIQIHEISKISAWSVGPTKYAFRTLSVYILLHCAWGWCVPRKWLPWTTASLSHSPWQLVWTNEHILIFFPHLSQCFQCTHGVWGDWWSYACQPCNSLHCLSCFCVFHLTWHPIKPVLFEILHIYQIKDLSTFMWPD